MVWSSDERVASGWGSRLEVDTRQVAVPVVASRGQPSRCPQFTHANLLKTGALWGPWPALKQAPRHVNRPKWQFLARFSALIGLLPLPCWASGATPTGLGLADHRCNGHCPGRDRAQIWLRSRCP